MRNHRAPSIGSGHVNGFHRFRQSANLIHFDEDGVGTVFLYPAQEASGVCDEQVIAHQLNIIAKGIRLAGVAADNLAIDDGEGNIGVGPNMDTDVWYSHTRLFQRGALLLENVANISELAAAMNGGATCNLVVGAPKHVRGTGGPSRVFAFCES